MNNKHFYWISFHIIEPLEGQDNRIPIPVERIVHQVTISRSIGQHLVAKVIHDTAQISIVQQILSLELSKCTPLRQQY
jgi:hypothetical protein